MTKQLKDAAKIALAHINWASFGSCRTEGHDGPPPTAREAFDALRSALAAPQPEPAGFEWPKPPPRKGQSDVLFDDGYDEGWASCIATLQAILVAPHPKQDYLETPIDWDLNGVPYTRKQAILDHCGPLALSYVEHAILYYTKD